MLKQGLTIAALVAALTASGCGGGERVGRSADPVTEEESDGEAGSALSGEETRDAGDEGSDDDAPQN